jgi:hypothetical protein
VKEELEKQLENEFPFMRRSDLPSTNLYRQYGFETGDGWFALLHSLFTEISATGHTFIPHQVKSKYGSLRLYYEPYNPQIQEIIDRYIELSEVTCEICGCEAELRCNKWGWMVTMCDECFKNENK